MTVNVALIQMSCGVDSRQNIDKAAAMVQQAAAAGANIVCLQELFASRYFPQTVDLKNYGLARSLPDESVALIQQIAADKQLVIIVPVYECARAG